MGRVLLVLLVLLAIGLVVGALGIWREHLAKRRAMGLDTLQRDLNEARKEAQALKMMDWRVRQIDAYVREQVMIHGESLENAMLLSIINRKPTAKEIEAL